MQVVIDLPEEMWEQVKDGYVPLGISKYLRNGTPLPKGHWIEREYNGIGFIECSECLSGFLSTHLLRNNYCPKCGAKMTESEE